MKIDFNNNGMTINFDKVPKFLYFNEESAGVGQVFFDGVRRKGLQDVKIQAHTTGTKGWPPLKYKIQYQEPGTNGSQFISNMEEELCIGVKILDTDIFKKFLDNYKQLLSDNRIPETVREEYSKKLAEIMEVQNEH
jgi:hypothetical protein